MDEPDRVSFDFFQPGSSSGSSKIRPSTEETEHFCAETWLPEQVFSLFVARIRHDIKDSFVSVAIAQRRRSRMAVYSALDEGVVVPEFPPHLVSAAVPPQCHLQP